MYRSSFKAQKKKDNLETMKEVLINDTNPILVCTNAMDKNHKCVFCNFYQCHMKSQEKADNMIQVGGNKTDKQKKNKKSVQKSAKS